MAAVDVGDDRVLWQETMNVPADDLVGMREQGDLESAAGTDSGAGRNGRRSDSSTRPSNEEAYDLYLRSVALAHDGTQNTEAVRMLERSVGLDPGYAPAWSALGKRYYYEEEYGVGATGTMSRTLPALRRALALGSESGRCGAADCQPGCGRRQIRAGLSGSEGDGGEASAEWFCALHAVVRAALCGTGKEAAAECDTALRLDPGNYQFRSVRACFCLLDNTTEPGSF